MTEISDTSFVQMRRLGFSSDKERYDYEKNKIDINKDISRLDNEAKKRAKGTKCLLCGRECSSFCNSHSIPSFMLQRIARFGKVEMPLQGELYTTGKDTGVKKAGTFQNICHSCDNTAFQDYEDPLAYEGDLSNEIFAEIAMKNYLQQIFKQCNVKERYQILEWIQPEKKGAMKEQQVICDYDLSDLREGFTFAKKALEGEEKSKYILYFYKVLDYIVPYASQAAISLVSSFNGELLNNPYMFNTNYKMKYLHIAVFPLEHSSVVLMFVEDGVQRYRKFYRQFRKMTDEEKLAIVNYIIFSYTENVYLNPDVMDLMRHNPSFMDVCKKTTEFDITVPYIIQNPLKKALEEFNLDRYTEIPNLLDRKYALKTEDDQKLIKT